MWVSYTEHTISKNQLPGKLIQYRTADLKVVSQKIGICSTWDMFISISTFKIENFLLILTQYLQFLDLLQWVGDSTIDICKDAWLMQ